MAISSQKLKASDGLNEGAQNSTAAGPGRGKKGKTAVPNSTAVLVDTRLTLADYGLDKKTSAVAQQLAALPAAVREAVAQRETTIARARREQKAATLHKETPLPSGRYRVLYADPPWFYRDKADDGAIQSGGAERHYPSMTIVRLCALDVPGITEPDAVLFLWVTSPLLFDAAPVIDAWGFTGACRARGHNEGDRDDRAERSHRGDCKARIAESV